MRTPLNVSIGVHVQHAHSVQNGMSATAHAHRRNASSRHKFYHGQSACIRRGTLSARCSFAITFGACPQPIALEPGAKGQCRQRPHDTQLVACRERRLHSYARIGQWSSPVRRSQHSAGTEFGGQSQERSVSFVMPTVTDRCFFSMSAHVC